LEKIINGKDSNGLAEPNQLINACKELKNHHERGMLDSVIDSVEVKAAMHLLDQIKNSYTEMLINTDKDKEMLFEAKKAHIQKKLTSLHSRNILQEKHLLGLFLLMNYPQHPHFAEARRSTSSYEPRFCSNINSRLFTGEDSERFWQGVLAP
jgi:hypothetical protein